jgi:hypothetical protein
MARRPSGRSSSADKVKIFLLPTSSRSVLGQPRLLSNGPQDLFPGEKQPGVEVNHLLPTSVEVKNIRIRLYGVELN